ncbi:uncharacterized protein LOC101088997 isoform X3 [Felis catus]|uniref:uncharacterized protein LOC101088997 isoform X3 n=1 Tax=Felis catus TaxID=9685 RepID=UPI001D19ECD3|nr:uncharacterized protein LOC101088997 isoform X3 [Felis catus]XP_044908117.1 uncharacterized protein LOC101088997 isoform X3 [Felis catus]
MGQLILSDERLLFDDFQESRAVKWQSLQEARCHCLWGNWSFFPVWWPVGAAPLYITLYEKLFPGLLITSSHWSSCTATPRPWRLWALRFCPLAPPHRQVQLRGHCRCPEDQFMPIGNTQILDPGDCL